MAEIPRSFRLRPPRADRRTLAAGAVALTALARGPQTLRGLYAPELHTKPDRHRPGLDHHAQHSQPGSAASTLTSARYPRPGVLCQLAGYLVVGLGTLDLLTIGIVTFDRKRKTVIASSYFSDITTPGNSALMSYGL